MARVRIAWQATALLLLLLLVGGTLLVAVTPGVVLPSIGGTANHYSNTPASSPSRGAAIAVMEQLTNPSYILGSQGVAITVGTSNLPSQDPAVRYMQALSNFSLRMQQIKSDLQVAQALAATGDENGALLIVNRLVALRGETRTLIVTLYSMLDLIQSQPKANQDQIQILRQRLDELRRIFLEYSIEIDQLRSQVTPRTVLLSVSVSNTSVFVNQPIDVRGQLQTRNGTGLANRNVTITWEDNFITIVTDTSGGYSAVIVFRPGYPNGTTVIGASFRPMGSDANVFVTTSASAVTQLEYYPTQIIAQISSVTTLPLDPVSVTGNLITSSAIPLENRALRLQLDNDFLGEVTTGDNGSFIFNFQVPPSASDGTHTLEVTFLPNTEIYAAAAANLPLAVVREQTEIAAVPSLNMLLSGMSLSITGAVSFAQHVVNTQGTLRGKVTILLDGNPSGISTIGDDGAFSLGLPIPLSSGFGTHLVQILYFPVDPRMDTSRKTVQVYVYNSEFVGIMALVAVLAPELVIVHRRRRRSLRISTQGAIESAEEPLIVLREVKPPMSMSDWESELRVVQADRDAARKVVMCYRLAQNFVCSKLGENLNDAETHLEFYERVFGLEPQLAPDLKRLADLFEVAEYSQYRIPLSYGEEAEERLLRIKDAD